MKIKKKVPLLSEFDFINYFSKQMLKIYSKCQEVLKIKYLILEETKMRQTCK